MSERNRLLDEVNSLIAQLATQGLEKQTSSLLDSSITLQQFRVLLHVYARGPAAIHQVAETLDFKPSVATGIVQRLVDHGLVERYEDPDDRRARLLRLTDQGLALAEEMTATIRSHRQQALARLSDRQLSQLRDILVAMTPDMIDPAHGPRAPKRGETARPWPCSK